MPYDLAARNRFGPEPAAALRQALGEKLAGMRGADVRQGAVDSPLFQLLGDWKPGDTARLKTDVFRERVRIRNDTKERIDRAEAAKSIPHLRAIEAERGPSAETGALIGSVYKDLWQDALERGRGEAPRYIEKAIDAYRPGFQADWRDAYPGINLATLLDVAGDPQSLAEKDRVVPVVRFAVEQRLKAKKPDYWDHATMLELAVVANEVETAREQLERALAEIRAIFEPETTARNLRLIGAARAARGEPIASLDEIVAELEERGRHMRAEVEKGRRS